MGDWTNNDYGREDYHKKTSYGIKTPVYGGLYNIKVKGSSCKTIDLSKYTPAILVFRGFLNLSNIEECKIGVSELGSNRKHFIYGFYNKNNNKYYIAFDQIQRRIRDKVFLDLKMVLSNDGTKKFDSCYYEFNEISLLKMYGYSVGKSGLDSKSRKMILLHLLENGIMTPFEITSHLQGLIALREARYDRDFAKAIDDWKRDIQFIREYRMSKVVRCVNLEIA